MRAALLMYTAWNIWEQKNYRVFAGKFMDAQAMYRP